MNDRVKRMLVVGTILGLVIAASAGTRAFSPPLFGFAVLFGVCMIGTFTGVLLFRNP
jgi:hypothetical protein